MPNPSQEPQASSKALIKTKRTWMFFATSKSMQTSKTQNMGLSKMCDHIQTKIKMPNPSQEPPASFKTPNQDIEVLCIS